jgi:UTP--glucose-1-phosphate uridylyltransferase
MKTHVFLVVFPCIFMQVGDNRPQYQSGSALYTMKKPLKKAIFPVGGLGTRFLPATKAMPKEMLPVASKPLIQHAFEEAVEAGIEQFIFITGRNKNAISNHFDHSYELQRVLTEKEKAHELALSRDWMPPAGSVAFIRQREPLGLGHAVWCARNFVAEDEPVAVLLADDLYLNKGGPGILKQMVDFYNDVGGNILAVADVPLEQTNRYGIVAPDGDDGKRVKVKGMVEKPHPSVAPSQISITGRYILQPEIFSYLNKQEKGSGGEIQLTDAMAAMLNTAPFYGLRFEGERFDCGSRIGFLDANIAFSLAENETHDRVVEIIKKYAGGC